MSELEQVAVRELSDNIGKYISKTTPFAITRQGQTVGYYIPARPIPSKAQRLALKKAGEAVDEMLVQHGVTEDELVQEFRKLREGHR